MVDLVGFKLNVQKKKTSSSELAYPLVNKSPLCDLNLRIH